jgi:hypothetical protein
MNFDALAQNIAEVIDGILCAERSHDRRIELIRHQVRRALSIGYRQGRYGDQTKCPAQDLAKRNQREMA